MFNFRRTLDAAIPDMSAGLPFGRGFGVGPIPGHNDPMRNDREIGRPWR